MIHLDRRLPLRRAMATLAVIAARDVGRTLAARIDTVVALQTISGNSGMVKWCSRPRSGGVASVALRGGRHVVYAFAACRNTVVTRRARSQYLGVIDLLSRTPQRYRMTCFT